MRVRDYGLNRRVTYGEKKQWGVSPVQRRETSKSRYRGFTVHRGILDYCTRISLSFVFTPIRLPSLPLASIQFACQTLGTLWESDCRGDVLRLHWGYHSTQTFHQEVSINFHTWPGDQPSLKYHVVWINRIGDVGGFKWGDVFGLVARRSS